MNIDDIMIIILNATGEKLRKEINPIQADEINNKLLMCKESIDYLKLKSEMHRNNLNFINNILLLKQGVDGYTTSPSLINLLEQKNSKLDKVYVSNLQKISSNISNYLYNDNRYIAKYNFSRNKSLSNDISSSDVITKLISLSNDCKKSLGLSKEDLDELDKIVMDINISIDNKEYQTDDPFNNYHIVCNYFDYITKDELLKINDIIEKIKKAPYELLRKLDLDIFIYSYYGKDETAGIIPEQSAMDNIANFIINNKYFIFYDKEILKEINSKLGFDLTSIEDAAIDDNEDDDIYQFFTTIIPQKDKSKDFGLRGLTIFINKYHMLTYIIKKDRSIIDKMKETSFEIYSNYQELIKKWYSDQIALNADSSLKMAKIKEYNEDLKKDTDIFDILFNLKNKYKLNKDKDYDILYDLFSKNGDFEELTPYELAVIILYYFRIDNKDEILSTKANQTFKNVEPLVFEIINKREYQPAEVTVINFIKNNFLNEKQQDYGNNI